VGGGVSERGPLYELLAALECEASTVTPAEAPALLGELERIRAAIWFRAMPPQASTVEPADRVLSLEEAATMLGLAPETLRRYSRRAPYRDWRIDNGTRLLRYSAARIRAHLALHVGRPTIARQRRSA
jgi:hypothetical protein